MASGATRAVGVRGALVGSAVALVAVLGLAVAEALHIDPLVGPADDMAARGPAAAIGVGLLVADIILPVPSSVVMLAHGAVFGVVPGALLSLLGRTGNAVVGVLLGRSAGSLLGRRTVGEQGQGSALVARWGLAAVVLTRPVPVLAESTLVAAAAVGLPPAAVIGAAVVGAVPEAVLYAVAGHLSASHASAAVVFVAVMALSAATWGFGARLDARTSRASEGTGRVASPSP